MKILILLLFLAICANGDVVSLGLVRTQDPVTVQTIEAVIRKAVVKSVLPKYPTSSRKGGKSGIAVAEVDFNETGRVTIVKVVEAPDREIGRSVEKAIHQWRFEPLRADGKPVRVHSKLTFYFVIERGKARVENPRRFVD